MVRLNGNGWDDNDPVGSASRMYRAVGRNHGRGFRPAPKDGCLSAVVVAAGAAVGAGALIRLAARAVGLA